MIYFLLKIWDHTYLPAHHNPINVIQITRQNKINYRSLNDQTKHSLSHKNNDSHMMTTIIKPADSDYK